MRPRINDKSIMTEDNYGGNVPFLHSPVLVRMEHLHFNFHLDVERFGFTIDSVPIYLAC